MKNYLTIFLFLYASAALAGILKIAPGDSRHLNLLPGRHFNPGVVSTSAPAAENPFAWDLNTNSRIFQYEFVDNTDPTADTTENNNTGDIIGATFTESNGSVSAYYDFGLTNHIKTSIDGLNSASNSGTIIAWLNPDSKTVVNGIIAVGGKDNGSSTSRTYIGFISNSFGGGFGQDSWKDTLICDTNTPIGIWEPYMLTWNLTTVELHTTTGLCASPARNGDPSSNDLYVGALDTAGVTGNYWTGGIDRVTFYSTNMTSADFDLWKKHTWVGGLYGHGGDEFETNKWNDPLNTNAILSMNCEYITTGSGLLLPETSNKGTNRNFFTRSASPNSPVVAIDSTRDNVYFWDDSDLATRTADDFDIPETTWVTWVKFGDLTGSRYPMSIHESTTNRFLLLVNNGDFTIHDDILNEGQTFTFAAGAFATGIWYHIVVTVTEKGIKTGYTNGVQAGSQDTDGTNLSQIVSSGTFSLGGQVGGADFNGWLDEIKIYDISLTSNQVWTIWNDTK